ncbi:MAG: hypothetical protein JWP91_4380 [Fibrobacteres bacterium]|nr:hypothetical protein [Fibrobacterota bacterium]
MDERDGDMHLDGDRICDLAEGAMGAAERAIAETHLQGCAACRREVEAAKGYFREMKSLEPVKAPANFLANVRARLPAPSPWRRLVSAISRPLRAIPLQIAVLTVIGITAISSYLYQRGGILETDRPVPGAVTRKMESAAPIASLAPESGSLKDGDIRTPEPPGKKSPGYSKDGPQSRSQAGAALKLAPAPVPRHEAEPSAKSDESAPSKAKAPEANSIAPARMAEAPVPGQPTYILSGAVRDEDALAGAASSHADAAQRGRLAAGENREAVEPEKKAEARMADEAATDRKDAESPPGYMVRLRNPKDTAAILAGLKAMGAEVVSAPHEEEPRYLLRLPPSAFSGIGPYLERYGKVERQGPFPSAPTGASSPLYFRMLLP